MPPSAQPINSADLISTSVGFLRGLPLGIYLLREPCCWQRCALSYAYDAATTSHGGGASRAVARHAPGGGGRPVGARAARPRLRSHLQPRSRRGDHAAAPGGRAGAQRPRQPSRARVRPSGSTSCSSAARSPSITISAASRRRASTSATRPPISTPSSSARSRARSSWPRRGPPRHPRDAQAQFDLGTRGRPAGDLHRLGRRTADGRVPRRAPQLRRRGDRPRDRPEAEGGRPGRRHLPVPRLDAVAADAPDGLRRPASAAARSGACR